MRRLLVFAVLLLAPLFAGAEPKDRLLTHDGWLYSIEVVLAADHPETATESSSFFVLSRRFGDQIQSEIVPATLGRGSHLEPSLAWESESGTLYVFWIRHMSLLFNELVFVSRTPEGSWSEATTLGTPWNFRENLTIAATRKVFDQETGALVPGISVHAAWWEFDSTTGNERAMYTMLTIENGKVVSIQELPLADFATVGAVAVPEAAPAPDDPALDTSVLEHPILTGRSDSVLLTFGSLTTRKLHQATIRPTLPPVEVNGRIRIPVGRGETSTGAPNLSVTANSRLDGVFSGDQMALFTREGALLKYVVMKNGAWSEERAIQLDEQVTSSSATEALRRMVHDH